MDKRQKRSRLRLHAALRSLLARQPLSEISVDALARKAGVTRPTFYAHFANIPAMLDEYVGDLLTKLEQNHRAHMEGTTPDTLEEKIQSSVAESLRALDPRDARLRCVMQGVPGLLPEMRFALLVETMMEEKDPSLHGVVPPELRRVHAHFFSSAFVGLLRLWVSDPSTMTPDDIGRHFCQLAMHGRLGAIPLLTETS